MFKLTFNFTLLQSIGIGIIIGSGSVSDRYRLNSIMKYRYRIGSVKTGIGQSLVHHEENRDETSDAGRDENEKGFQKARREREELFLVSFSSRRNTTCKHCM